MIKHSFSSFKYYLTNQKDILNVLCLIDKSDFGYLHVSGPLYLSTRILRWENGLISQYTLAQIFIPEPTARSAVPGEGTNSARLFTPAERNALAKSKVHQISRAHGVWVVISLISKMRRTMI